MGAFALAFVTYACMGYHKSLEAWGALVDDELKWRWQTEAHRA